MNKIGVHALSWVGGWSEAEARKAIDANGPRTTARIAAVKLKLLKNR